MAAVARSAKLNLDPALVRRARSLARTVGRPVVRMARAHTTVSVERAVLRLAGVSGADPDGIPWVNRLTDAVAGQVGLSAGVALPVFDALAAEGLGGGGEAVTLLAQKAAAGSVTFRVPEGRAARHQRRDPAPRPGPRPARQARGAAG